jgi:hypothetical protein
MFGWISVKSFQEYVVQQLSTQYMTDGSFGKLTVVEVGCLKFPKVLGFEMSFFPSSCKAFHIIPSYLHQSKVQW